MKQHLLLVSAALALLVGPASAEFYSIPWTSDATAGVTAAKTVWAYNFGTTTNATVNGVTFTGISGNTPSVAGRFAVTGTIGTLAYTTNLPAGSGSATLAANFLYGGNPATITLSGLTAGQVYEKPCPNHVHHPVLRERCHLTH